MPSLGPGRLRDLDEDYDAYTKVYLNGKLYTGKNGSQMPLEPNKATVDPTVTVPPQVTRSATNPLRVAKLAEADDMVAAAFRRDSDEAPSIPANLASNPLEAPPASGKSDLADKPQAESPAQEKEQLVKCEGYVQKRSKVLKQWRRRYLVLAHDGHLSSSKERGQPRSTMFVKPTQVDAGAGAGNRDFGQGYHFTVTGQAITEKKFGKSVDVYHFNCDDAETQQRWIDAIRAAINAK